MGNPGLHRGTSKNGYGVFADWVFASGETIMLFGGERFSRSQLPVPYDEGDDHFVQIGPDQYMGPSGQLDDFVNHSCDPNAGLVINRTDVILVAIRPIVEQEEITWDYSTTMDEDEWELACLCGSSNCRKTIRDFRHLAPELRKRYGNLGIVPSYLSRYVE